MQNDSNVTIIESGNATLAGNQGYKLVYTTNYSGTLGIRKTMELWTVKDGKAYIITYRARPGDYDVSADTVQKMIDSFKIK